MSTHEARAAHEARATHKTESAHKTVVSSYVLETLPNTCEQAKAAVSELEGVEIHHQEGGKLVVTIEAPSLDATYALATTLTRTPGILTTNLVYCNFEDEYR